MFELKAINENISDLIKADPGYLGLESKIADAIKESQEIIILCEDDINTASHYIKNFKALDKEIETGSKFFTRPMDEEKKKIAGLFKGLSDMIEPELKRLSDGLLNWKRKQEEIERQRQNAERKRLEEEALRLAIAEEERRKAEAEEKGIAPEEIPAVEPMVIAETIAPPVKISSLNTSGVMTRRTKKYEVVDMVQFVRSLTDSQIKLFLEVNSKNMNAFRGQYDFDDKSPIPGVKFFYSESV